MSTDKQDRSIPEQRDWAKEAGKARGVDLVADFKDEAIPGSEIERRSGLMALVEFCEAQADARRPISVLVVWDVDRLSRASSIRTAAVLDRLMEAGVTAILTNGEMIDLESDLDVVMLHLKQDLTHSAESRKIGARSARSCRDRARQGRWVAGKPPYGYVVGEGGKLVPGPAAETETVLWMFTRYAEGGASLGDLARELNERKVAGPGRCGKWRRDTMHRMLTARVYTGTAVYNATHQGKYFRVGPEGVTATKGQRARRVFQRNAEADLIVVEANHPALIAPTLFARVQARLSASAWRRTTPQPGGGEWALSGLVRCGDCGGPMYGRKEAHTRPSGSYVYRRYFCSANSRAGKGVCRNNGVHQERLLRALAAFLRESFSNPARVAELRAELEKAAGDQAQDTARETARLEGQIAALDARIQTGRGNLLWLSRDMIAGAEGVLRGMEEERQALARRREALLQQAVQQEADREQVGQALRAIAELEASITTAPAALVRQALGRLIKSVTVEFNHALPANQSHAVAVHVTTTPEAADLLPSGAISQRVCITVRHVLGR
jgi:site-specific DNA recombinase